MTGFSEAGVVAKVRGFVSSAVGCSPERITAVSHFQDGNRHDVYKVSLLGAVGTNQVVVVRVSFDGGPADRAQAAREAGVLREVGGLGAPLLYDFRSTSPWFDTPAMCMEFVPGSSHELGAARSEELRLLGSVVAALHGRPAGDLVASFDASGDIASYADERLTSILSGLRWVRPPLPAPVRDRLASAAGALKSLWQGCREAESFSTGETLALLHGDIGPGNVLWGPDPVLIDWEYTRFGDPADEIAYLFDQNALDTPRRAAFWDGYRGGAGQQMQLAHVTERVDWWERLTLLGSTLWWVERWVRRTDADAAGTPDPAVPRQQDYYLDHVTSRLDRLEHLLT